MSTAYLSHPGCSAHLAGSRHPECPERLSAIHDRFVADGLIQLLHLFEAPRATKQELERVHSSDYIQRLYSKVPESESIFLDQDTMMDSTSLEAALRAAGATIRATDLVLGGKMTNAFCNVRPPGHHATRGRAMGFCFFNNVALGAAHALQAWGLNRVAIVDFDAHRGNGTEEMVSDDPRLLFCSAWQRGLFPLPNPVPATSRIINVELERETESEVFRKAVQESWLPALEEFEPEMIFVSAGFDAHVADSISDLLLVDDDFRWISELIVEVANRHAKGCVVSVLEGGYQLEALGRCAALHIRALLGI